MLTPFAAKTRVNEVKTLIILMHVCVCVCVCNEEALICLDLMFNVLGAKHTMHLSHGQAEPLQSLTAASAPDSAFFSAAGRLLNRSLVCHGSFSQS